MRAACSNSAKQLKTASHTLCSSRWGRICAGRTHLTATHSTHWGFEGLVLSTLWIFQYLCWLYLIRVLVLNIILCALSAAQRYSALPHLCKEPGSETRQHKTPSWCLVEKSWLFAKLHTTLLTFFYIQISAPYSKAIEFETFQCNPFWSDPRLAGYFGRHMCLEACISSENM